MTTPGWRTAKSSRTRRAPPAPFILRAAEHFATHGIPTIERVITDNHFSYRKSNAVKDAMTTLGATQKFIQPHCPWPNGKVEKFNRTLAP